MKLDITKPADAESAVRAAMERFGRIGVLVNNAANFYAGFFEELTPEQMERQTATSLIGPMNVARAVLPVMRKQRSGLIITFGIDTITVNPGFFRTELLTAESTNFAERTIDDYNGQQPGDPVKLAQALITISGQEKPPRRFLAGADAVETAEKAAATLQQQTDAYRKLSSSPAYS